MNYIAALTSVNRFASQSTTSAERSVLFFILERTLRFNKVSETIPYRHFLDGVYDRSNGEVVVAGVGLSRKTVIETVKSLRKRGLIEISVGRNNANIITLLLDKLEKFIKMAKLNTSKKFKELGGGVKFTLGGCKRSTTKKHSNKQSQVEPSSFHSEGFNAAPAETALEAVERVQRKYQSTQDARIQALATVHHGPDKLRHAFQAVIAKHYDHPILVANPSGREWRTYKNFLKSTKLPQDFNYPEFFEHIIEHWTRWFRKDGPLTWVKDAPMAPNLSFYCRFIKHFLTAYIENQQFMKSLTHSDSKYVNLKAADAAFENICKSNRELQEKIKDLEKKQLTPRQQHDLKIAIHDQRVLAEQQIKMNRRVKALQMENARLRAKHNDNSDLEEELPTYAQAASRKDRRTKETVVPVAARKRLETQ